MAASLKLLIIEDIEADFLLVEHHLRQQGRPARCRWATNAEQLTAALDEGGWNAVLCGYNVPGLDFRKCLAMIRTRFPDLPVILFSGSVGEEAAVDLLKYGVWDFILKDNLVRLIPAIDRCLGEAVERRARREAEKAQQFSLHLLEILHRHTAIPPLLKEFVREIRAYTGCDAVGIRVLDDEGNIPYQAYEGFSQRFFESESPLSIKSDQCMCINVIKGTADPGLPFYTAGGSFYMNATTLFLATVSEEAKGKTRNVCNATGFESVALVPFRSGGRILGLIHVADRRENMVPLHMVKLLEQAAMQLGTAFQRARAEDTLRKSEERYRSLFDNMLEGFAYCRMMYDEGKPADFIYLAVNTAFATLTGLRNVVGRKVSEVIPGIRESATELFESFGRVALTGNTERFETYVAPLDAWFSIAVYSPESEHFIAVFDIITERKRAEEQLREQEARFRKLSQEFQALLDNVPDGIVLFAPDLTVHWANKTLLDHVGGAACVADVAGHICHETFWNYPAACPQCPVVRSFNSARFEAGTITTPAGKILELRAAPIIGESGRVESVIEIMRDITEHRKLEEQLRQAQKMESIGTLAGGIAHDFNNMLTAIIGYGNLALSELARDNPLRHDIDGIIEAADRAAHLTKGLLLFSRKQVSDRKAADVNEIIRMVEKFLQRVIGEDIECTTMLEARPLPVLADAHQLEQVLMNLATNAKDAMPGGGAFSITSELTELDADFVAIHSYGQPGPHALLTVSDSGHGMDEQTRHRIFEPFFTTKEVGKGTGLGLAVVYGIIRQHDGFINVYSEPGRGTTFRIYLPLMAAAAAKEEKKAEAEQPTTGQETVLIAEDDASLRKLFRSILQRAGYTVIEAVDGEDAVRKFMKNKDRINLLLFDIIMPKMNGKEAYDAIRQIEPNIKAIFASGYAPGIIRQKAVGEEELPIIFKPMSPRELLKKMRLVLDGE
jgi:signal transduction histidine kinase/DNA-binding response OmpR family regulator